MTDRLFRSPTDRLIAGVAGGLATWLNLDPSLVRVAWVLLAIVSGGVFVLVYFVMMIVVPLPPQGWVPRPRGAADSPVWPAGAPWTAPASNPPTSRVDGGNAGIVFGAVLVLLGAWFLVDRYVRVDWDLLWPVVVIGLGVVLIAGAMRRGRPPGG